MAKYFQTKAQARTKAKHVARVETHIEAKLALKEFIEDTKSFYCCYSQEV